MFAGYIGYMTFILSGVNNQEIHKQADVFVYLQMKAWRAGCDDKV